MEYLILPDGSGDRADTQLAMEFTPEQIEEKKAQGYVLVSQEDFDLLIGNGDKEYCIDSSGKLYEKPAYAPTFDELKARKLAEMKASFDARVSGSFTTSQGFVMQFNESDSNKMNGAITLYEASGAETGYLTQADDVTVYDVPIATMRAVLLEMLNAYAQCHQRKQQLRAAINACTTADELDAVEITWPV